MYCIRDQIDGQQIIILILSALFGLQGTVKMIYPLLLLKSDDVICGYRI